MSNDANRTFIVLVAAAWIVLMAVLIFFTWTADKDVIDRLGDFVEYLAAHNDNAGKLIVTLGALVTVVLALLLIIVQVAPEDEDRELRVEQAGATTIVPATALRQRLEEAVSTVPQVTAARAKVSTKDKGIVAALDVTLLPGANVSAVTQDVSRVVVDTVQTDLGLPVVGLPTVRVSFASGRAVASSMAQAPAPPPAGEEPSVVDLPSPPDELAVAPETEAAPEPVATQEAPQEPAPYNPWSPPAPPSAPVAPSDDQSGNPENPQP